ncbi:hypothetical protein BRADI_1g59151v3 [Brachypodium distachyon]|uniref:Uncharacterized protein n=1 Tax=Brachypodium distachyon TaxID=15368 RepID=A0A0Q3LDX2_BRADI|nr:hypothetical protein BRADI_1g59151v3 [Brachypodium distachyon]
MPSRILRRTLSSATSLSRRSPAAPWHAKHKQAIKRRSLFSIHNAMKAIAASGHFAVCCALLMGAPACCRQSSSLARPSWDRARAKLTSVARQRLQLGSVCIHSGEMFMRTRRTWRSMWICLLPSHIVEKLKHCSEPSNS